MRRILLRGATPMRGGSCGNCRAPFRRTIRTMPFVTKTEQALAKLDGSHAWRLNAFGGEFQWTFSECDLHTFLLRTWNSLLGKLVASRSACSEYRDIPARSRPSHRRLTQKDKPGLEKRSHENPGSVGNRELRSHSPNEYRLIYGHIFLAIRWSASTASA
jgi:hypothetical protein